MFLPRLSKFTMESLLLVGLLLINHSCVLGNGSSSGLQTRRELSSSYYHNQNFSEDDKISNDVPNEVVSTAFNDSFSDKKGCQLPGEWAGKYFQHGTEVEIDGNSISGKGVCQENQGDKYLFVLPEDKEHCYKCVVILQKHQNIIQYKESDCEGEDTLENLCDTIPGDAQLQTLFRINGKPEECPFSGGPFKFSYSQGGRPECLIPESFVETCSDTWKLSFNFQACPMDISSQSKVEELHCLAHWEEGSTNYLVGTVNGEHREKWEDRYRCFVFEEIRSMETGWKGRGSQLSGHTGIFGYKIAQSGDATCSGMYSPTDGEVNFSLRVFKEEKSCKFPKWMSSSEWNTLDGGKVIKVLEKEDSFLVSDRENGNSSRAELIYPILRSGTRVICQERADISQDQLAVVVQSTKGCQKNRKMCLNLYKRSELIIEMQIVTESHTEENFQEECTNGSLAHVAGNPSPFLTLVNSRAEFTQCPFQGKFSVSGLTKNGEYIRNMCAEEERKEELNVVNVACKQPQSFDILSKCNLYEEPQEFQCVAHWNESDKGFLIVSNTIMPMSSLNPSYCCSYKESPSGYYISVSDTSCERNLFPSVAVLSTFNLTKEAPCVEPRFEASGAQLIQCDTFLKLLIMSVFISLISPILTIVSAM